MLPNVFPGRRRHARIQHRRCEPVVHRGVARLCRGDRRRGGAAPGLSGAGRHRRLAHPSGTRYGIGVDPADGLLRAGEPGVQLTWMDARVGDWVVTPRIGKPVEINALWYNALSRDGGDGRADRRRRRERIAPRRPRREPGFAPFRAAGRQGPLRRDRRAGRDRCEPAAEPDFCRQPAGEPARSGDAARRARSAAAARS